ncbi:MAG: DUF6438 domain-containing protein [Flavobacteriales bacterium]
MKKILYIFILSALILGSCKNRKNKKETEEVVKTETVKTEVSSEEAPAEVMMNDEEAETLVVMSLSRSVCFGTCPAFEAKIFGNGIVVYEGIKNVKRLGKYKGKISVDEINRFMLTASKLGFFKLKDKYDNPNVTDLPTAVTFLNYNGKKKKVICRFECDEAVQKINKMFDELLDKTAMKQFE